MCCSLWLLPLWNSIRYKGNQQWAFYWLSSQDCVTEDTCAIGGASSAAAATYAAKTCLKCDVFMCSEQRQLKSPIELVAPPSGFVVPLAFRFRIEDKVIKLFHNLDDETLISVIFSKINRFCARTTHVWPGSMFSQCPPLSASALDTGSPTFPRCPESITSLPHRLSAGWYQ